MSRGPEFQKFLANPGWWHTMPTQKGNLTLKSGIFNLKINESYKIFLEIIWYHSDYS